MNIELSYGNGKVCFDVPDKNLAGVIRPGKSQQALTQEEITAEISRGKCANEFSNSIKGKNLCVLVPDGTRDLPIETVLAEFAIFFEKPKLTKFVICTGTHNSKTERNRILIGQIESLMHKIENKNFEIVTHDCEKAEFINAGTTSRQTPVFYNAVISEMDVFLALSDVKHHYFAGYSNPVKTLVPGICSYKTTEQNHRLSLDENSRFGAHPWHQNEKFQDNPLAADQTEAAEMILNGRHFWAAVMISSNCKIKWLRFGKAKDVARQAFSKADEWNVYKVEPVERMIVSCGASPNDIDLYIAQRALELTKQAIADGGEILFAAACDNGIGAERTMEHFWNLLTKPMDEIFEEVKNKPYKLFSHKPLRFAELIKRLRKLWLYSQLPDETVKAGHMYPSDDVQKIINQWISEKSEVKILVVDGANKLALRRI